MNLSSDMIVDLVINIVSIIVLFAIVRVLAYKPVKKFLTERSERVAAEKEKAQQLAADAEEKSRQCEEMLEENKKLKDETVRQGEAEAKIEAQKIIDEAGRKAEKMISDAEKKAAEIYNNSVEDSRKEIIDISLQMSSAVLSREVSDDDNRKLVDEFLNELEGRKNA